MTHYCKAKSEKYRYTFEHVYGECLEELGVPSKGGHALIDRIIDPKVGDIVWCSGEYAGGISGYLKQIKDIGADGDVIVGTAYKDSSRDYTFVPEEILGTVIMVFNILGNVVYHRRSE